MQSASSRIWTRVAVSISYDDNHYTTGTTRLQWGSNWHLRHSATRVRQELWWHKHLFSVVLLQTSIWELSSYICMNTDKMELMCFNQDTAIFLLDDKPFKLVDPFLYLGLPC